MIYNCAKCGLSKSDGAMGSVLPQCKCDWNLTAPPKKEWVGLTDEERQRCFDDVEFNKVDWCPDHEQYAKAIEAKLKEKNNAN
jgi:hypothetical protein